MMLRITRGQWRTFLGATTVLPLASLAIASAESPRDDLSQPLGTNELASFLKLELQEARKDLKNAAKVAIGNVHGSHKLSFPTPRDAIVHEKILHEFISRLEPNSPLYAGRYIEAIASKSNPSVQYVFMDGSGSAQFMNDQFTLFLDKPVKGDITAFVAAYRASHVGGQGAVVSRNKAIEDLAKLGLDIYDGSNLDSVLTWDSLAGYSSVKAEIQDTIVLALQNPELYEAIAKQTRCRYESNRPRAVLFEGPPGTGKTLSARIIAAQAGVPLVHIPVESVVSKWYGESEKKMAAIFEACEKLDGAIIFIDEIDALATDRSTGGLHEATRRMLSVLLQKLEGFQSAKKVTLIAATNRKQDLDAALLSRFNLSIRYDLPDNATRQAVFQRYAKQLSQKDLEKIAELTQGKSCRDIKEICEYAERKWASQVLRGEKPHNSTPTVDAYVGAVNIMASKPTEFVDI